MRQTILSFLGILLCVGIASSCSEDIEVKQDYGFTVTYLPVPKKLAYGETTEIRCEIIREGYYEGTAYKMRYFQPDGQGELTMDDGTVFKPNDYYSINRDIFRLYYTCLSTEQQSIDLYFFDNFDNACTLSFSFNTDTSGGEQPEPEEPETNEEGGI